uniref:Uncharacterized protein n=1 Tax=Anguilla anguilla TaxID=7936 RepID=A0A0E9QMR2_ANGAN
MEIWEYWDLKGVFGPDLVLDVKAKPICDGGLSVRFLCLL